MNRKLLLPAAIALSAAAACTNPPSTSNQAVSSVPPPHASSEANVAAESPASTLTPMFGLETERDGYRLAVSEAADRGGQAVEFDLDRDGKPLWRTDPGLVHWFAIGEGLSFFEHEPLMVRPDRMDVGGTGQIRVVVAFVDDGSEIVLGTDVDVRVESDFSAGGLTNPTMGDRTHASGVMVERDGWDFDVTGTFTDERRYDYGAWLTVVREADLAISTQQLDQTGDGAYRFDPTLSGPGDHLAVLEVTGAPAFSFFLTVDESGTERERAESDVVDAVSAFVRALDAGDAEALNDAMTSRCRDLLGDLRDQLDEYADPTIRHWETSIVATIGGAAAMVEYETIAGDYVIGETPHWTGRREQWVLEGGSWRRDECPDASLGW